MYEQVRRIEYSNLSPEKSVSVSEILRFLQDIAVAHTTACGYSLQLLSEMKRAWILLSTHIKFKKSIKFPSDIKIKTWTYDFARAFGPRAFVITDYETGEEYASASAMWTFVDTETGRLKEIPKDILECFGTGITPEVEYIRRSANHEAKNHYADYRVLKRDLDSNFHVNNVKYVEYAMEAIEESTLVKEIEIYYRHPTYLGDKLSLYIDKNENDEVIMNFRTESGETCTYVKFIVETKASVI